MRRGYGGIVVFLLLIALAALMPEVVDAASRLSGGDTTPGRTVFEPVISKIGELAPNALGLPGERVVWTISVANHGEMAGANVVITDTVRAELRVDDVATERGSYTIDGQTVTLAIPVLNPGESVVVQVTTTVLRSPASGLLVNQASLLASGPDGEVSGTARAEVSVPSGLPATGYPPDFPGEGEPPVWAVGLGAFALVGATALVVWRRGSRVRLTLN